MQLRCHVQLIYSTKVQLFAIIFLDNYDTFVPLCSVSKNVEVIWRFHKDLRATISTSLVLLIEKERSRFVTCHFARSISPLMCCASPVISKSWMSVWPFLNYLHLFFWEAVFLLTSTWHALFCILFANWHSPATLTEVFPCVFLSCKANVRGITRKDEARSALFLISELCCSMYCLGRLCISMYCVCVNVYCTTATGCQPNCS
jgi:hypothetical protein